MSNSSTPLAWETFYSEFADKLLLYKNNRADLLKLLEESYKETGQKFPFMESGEPIDDICPFSVFGAFNKGITKANRIALIQSIGKRLEVTAPVPTNFDGIPVLNNLRAWFFGFSMDRKPDDIDNLWDMMEVALFLADAPDDEIYRDFVMRYNTVTEQALVKWNLTMGLYWIRPSRYLNLDAKNRDYLLHGDISKYVDLSSISNLKELPDGVDYLKLVDLYRNAFRSEKTPVHSFAQLSRAAWVSSTTDIGGDVRIPWEKRYWEFAPGATASRWDEFLNGKIMALGFDQYGDLSTCETVDDVRAKMKEVDGEGSNPGKTAGVLWKFSHLVEPGDIVFVRGGRNKLLGRGIVTSNYRFDSNRTDFRHVCEVNWTDSGTWNYNWRTDTKTLTDLTDKVGTIQELNAFFDEEIEEPIGEKIERTLVFPEKNEVEYASYSEDDFLEEVFMDDEMYHTLVELLRIKKNIIIQGAPGVGKTFIAKRLAYSMIGKKDSERVKMVQFHQSYSYEDFIIGFRPTETGFKLTEGPFYEFCQIAKDDRDQEYFFIIDEINRGNLSKIFGELLMLIENDKRGEKLRLLYENELFSVPENVYLIGLMNTADRSLAMIDYALRRRFAFFEMEPAFESKNFIEKMNPTANVKMAKLIDCVKLLNNAISQDDSLGPGFRIGHSYFCPKSEVTDGWLTQIVKYELCPILSEYWFDNKDEYNNWKTRLEEAVR